MSRTIRSNGLVGNTPTRSSFPRKSIGYRPRASMAGLTRLQFGKSGRIRISTSKPIRILRRVGTWLRILESSFTSKMEWTLIVEGTAEHEKDLGKRGMLKMEFAR